jgi:hypothetical protein
MFNGLTTTNTPAYATYDYRSSAAVPFNLYYLSLADDCPPVIYILQGPTSTSTLQINLPSNPTPGKQITIKADTFANLQFSTISIFAGSYSIFVFGGDGCVTLMYAPQVTAVSASSNTKVPNWIILSNSSISSTQSTYYGAIAMGQNNAVQVNSSISIGGASNTAAGQYAATIGGSSNQATGQYGFVGGGNIHTLSQSYSAIVGGYFSSISGQYSGMLSGYNHNIGATYAAILAGQGCTVGVNSPNSIVGGYSTNAQSRCIFAYNGPAFSATNTALWVFYTLGKKVTSSASALLTVNGTAGTAYNQLTIQRRLSDSLSCAMYFKCRVVALQAVPALVITGASGDGTNATVTFAAQAIAPFPAGSYVIVSGMTPAGYNTPATGALVVSSTTTSITYANTTTSAFSVGGTTTAGSSYTASWIIEGTATYTSAGTLRFVGTPTVTSINKDTGVSTSDWTLVTPTIDTTNNVINLTFTSTSATSTYFVNVFAKCETSEVGTF